jgi:hypothetical protein
MTHARLNVYLRELSKLCIEVSTDHRLLPTFLAVLARAPGTILKLLGTSLPMKRVFLLRS